jgi:hypothetical protein
MTPFTMTSVLHIIGYAILACCAIVLFVVAIASLGLMIVYAWKGDEAARLLLGFNLVVWLALLLTKL